MCRAGQQYSYACPRDDVNAPDMYIPTMAFITYVLVVGVAMGQLGSCRHCSRSYCAIVAAALLDM